MPPLPKGVDWIKVVGPGVIVLGLSIGGGEFLLGPTAFVRYGCRCSGSRSCQCFSKPSSTPQLMRYMLATGEPVFTGFMRTRPGRMFWAGFTSRCTSCRPAGPMPRDFPQGLPFFWRPANGGCCGHRHHLHDRDRHVHAVCRSAARGTPRRTDPRAAELGDGGVPSSGDSSRCRSISCRLQRGSPPFPVWSDSAPLQAHSISCPVKPTSGFSQRSPGILVPAGW